MRRAELFCIIFLIMMQGAMSYANSDRQIDSLLTELKKQKEDTNKVNLLNELSWEYVSKHIDQQKAFDYAQEALLLSRNIRYRKGEATANRRLGGIVINKGAYNDALNYYNEELKIQEELGDKKRMAAGHMQIGSVFYYLGNYPAALESYLKGLSIAEEIKDLISASKINNNIGLLYTNTEDYPEALKYYNAALKVYEELGDKEGIAKECCGIGNIYFSQKNFEDALIYFRKSLKLAEETGMKRLAATCYIDIGEVYTVNGDYSQALENQFKALKISQEVGDEYLGVHINKSIGWTYFCLRKWDEARKYLNTALSKARETGLLEGMESSFYRLSKLDSAVGNFKSSYENYKMFVLYRDSIMNSDSTEKMARQQMRYEYEKTDKLAKAEQAKKDLRQSIISYSILGILVIITIFLIIVFRQRNKIRAEKKISEEQSRKAEIAMKNAETEKERSESLLLNILPEEVADEIKRFGHSKAKTFSMVTVMLTDFKDFTVVSDRFSAELLVAEIDYCFSAFDRIVKKFRVEKIKTVGDAYLCVGGLPVLTTSHALDVVSAAIEIRDFMLERKKEQESKGGIVFEVRLGINTGPVVAGIVGLNKYGYDIWGNTVNLAARMEQHSEAGKINISGSTYMLVKDKFRCEYRGKIEAKNKGEVEMYFVESLETSARRVITPTSHNQIILP